jgi:hypothetical protein
MIDDLSLMIGTDHLLAGHVASGVVVKSIASPAIGIALVAAAATATARRKTTSTPSA